MFDSGSNTPVIQIEPPPRLYVSPLQVDPPGSSGAGTVQVRQMRVPVLASSAITLLPGVVMNIRPWFTIGVVSWASTRSVLNDQARDSLPMLLAVICLRGLKPEPSYVRRYISQSPASGCCSRSSVTVGYVVDPTCTRSAATRAAGRHSHNVRYDAG